MHLFVDCWVHGHTAQGVVAALRLDLLGFLARLLVRIS